LLPLVLLLDDASLGESIFLIVCYILLAAPLGPVRFFPKVLLMLTLFIYLGREYWTFMRPKFIVAAVVFAALIAYVDARRHMLSYADEPGQRFERVAVEKGALFSSSPAVSRQGIFYQSIARNYDRFVLHWSHDGQIDELSFEGHAFHPVVAAKGGSIYFELVAHGTSTLMAFDPSTQKVAPGSMPVASDETDSVVSPNGKWVAYVSTQGGPKQIWLRNVASASVERLTGGNCNSSSPAWELNSSAILFASDCGRAIGLPALYRAQVPVKSAE
jgi:Tol biopolymer transport system component